VKTVPDEVVGHSLAYLSVWKWLVGGRALLRENLANTETHPLHNADFQSIFARSASAVTSSKKVQFNYHE